jgi:hypothetical protein
VGLAKDSVILLEQIRTLDKRRLKEKMGHLDDRTMDHVNMAIAISFGLGNPQEDAAARAMMQRVPAYTPRTPAAVASTAATATGQTTAPQAMQSVSHQAGNGTASLHNEASQIHNKTE